MKKSKYIVESRYDNKCLIISTISGAIVEIENEIWDNINTSDEVELIDYCKKSSILLEDDFDEDNYINDVRKNSNLSNHRPHSFVVLPTTACNARCFYCYEEGMIKNKMSNDTAEQVAIYILKASEGKNIRVQWFGGEPLMGADAIDIICTEIKANLTSTQKFETTMITNGSLINKTVINKMLNTWNLSRVQITLDGLSDEYEKRKNYRYSFSFDNLIDNIKALLNNKITVAARINFDRNNFRNILELIDFLGNNIDSEYFNLYAVPLFDNETTLGKRNCFLAEELDDCYMSIYNKMIENGFIKSTKYFSIGLKSHFCGANTIAHSVIDPDGNIYKCQHLNIETNKVISDVYSSAPHNSEQAYWIDQDISDICKDCRLIPMCQGGCRASNGNDGILRCCIMKYTMNSTIDAIKKINERRSLL